MHSTHFIYGYMASGGGGGGGGNKLKPNGPEKVYVVSEGKSP